MRYHALIGADPAQNMPPPVTGLFSPVAPPTPAFPFGAAGFRSNFKHRSCRKSRGVTIDSREKEPHHPGLENRSPRGQRLRLAGWRAGPACGRGVKDGVRVMQGSCGLDTLWRVMGRTHRRFARTCGFSYWRNRS